MSAQRLAQRMTRCWFQSALTPALYPLLPLSWLFGVLAGWRRLAYRRGWLAADRLPVPVVVVGNVTVGGSGKTPLVLWLARELRAAGWQPGIISRGYGGAADSVLAVSAASDAAVVGDEPLLLARRSALPVFVGRDRARVARALLAAHPRCDVIISDDGLQHYRLQRDLEIAVFDARGAGNGRLLPAGPLREPLRRLSAASALVWNSLPADARGPIAAAAPGVPQFGMSLGGECFHALHDARRRCGAQDLRGRRLYALAGIGDPRRFFAQLESLGLAFEAHPFPDHHRYSAADLAFADDGVLLMTEKDAVKCAALPPREAWVLPVDARIATVGDGPTLLDTILEKLDGRTPA